LASFLRGSSRLTGRPGGAILSSKLLQRSSVGENLQDAEDMARLVAGLKRFDAVFDTPTMRPRVARRQFDHAEHRGR
jgi:hypothetical protein